MERYEALEYLMDELRDTDPEQFEYLCEEVIRKVENPVHSEVTPFNNDRGIDIRGRTGEALYSGEFGVQVKKKSSSNVSAPEIQRFAGALEVDGSNFGTFITTSDFSKQAHRGVEDMDVFSIELVNCERLAEIMLDHELGVICQSESDKIYAKDYGFWNQFEVDKDLIPSEKVPQADRLDILELTVQGVSNGCQFKPEIADWLIDQTDEEWTRRQGDYYAIAAHAIGMLSPGSGKYEVNNREQEIRKWNLTPAGREYVDLLEEEPEEADKFLYNHIRELEIIRLIIAKIKQETAILQEEIADVIRDETAVSGSTAKRRGITIGRWLGEMDGDIQRIDNAGQIKYAYQKPLEDFN